MDLLPFFKKNPSVSTDTRKIKKGDIFFALKGDNFDGNKFAAQALHAGASFAVIDDPQYFDMYDMRYILVNNVLESLQELATAWRKELGIKIIGLTGSNGKTTTKELLASVLETEKQIFATRGNYNNHIGVPLTLLSIPSYAELAIVEMGANQPGDIQELADIALPDIGLITNVGYAHLEKLGDLNGVRKTKGALFDHVGNHGGLIFVNASDPHVVQAASPYSLQITYGTADAHYHYEVTEQGLNEMELKVYGHKWEIPLILRSKLTGSYNCMNILAATAIAAELGVGRKSIVKGIFNYRSGNNRSQVVKKGPYSIWLDAYNANPTSMKASIQNILSMDDAKVALILGDMYELGEEEAALHAEIGTFAQDLGPSLIIGVGSRMKHAIDAYKGEAKHWFESKEDLGTKLPDILAEAGVDTLLIKGSRSMAMEELVGSL